VAVLSPQLKRLLAYVKPYRWSMSVGVVLLAVSGVAEILIALMFRPIVDRVLNLNAPDSNVLLFTIPYGGPSLYLNHFFPPSIHNVWTVVSISLLIFFFAKSITEYGGSTIIQFVGHRAITDLRNTLYEKIIRLPMGFFQQEPTGKVMSAVINDVERARPALSEYLADVFRQTFLFFAFLIVLLVKIGRAHV
jgi:ABC-type multidrug transport system fused ATPase/permease subunit